MTVPSAIGPRSLGVSGRIAGFFLESRLTPLIALVLTFFGVFALAITPREEEPQIDVTMANVFVPFPGASAADVEQLVAIPAEQVLSQIQGLEHVWSVSRPGEALITVQYKVGVKRNDAVVRLHDTILSHRDWLPKELRVGEPLVKPKGIDDVPIVALTLSTRDPLRSAFDLERVAHAVEAEVKRVPGTREVTTIGGPGRAIQVLLDVDRLNAVGLAVGDMARMLQAANTAMPAGDVVRANEMVRIETGEFLQSAQDVRDLVIGVHDGQPVFVSDVARVVDGPPHPARYTWHGIGKAGAASADDVGRTLPAVTIQVTKKAGENAVDVAQRVEQRMAELSNTVIPEGVEVSVTRDYGRTADDKAKMLMSKLAFATLSVVALVFFALGRREAAIVGVAVVLTLAATLFASWAWGFTLNRVSLFALIFSIGILVDDAIVVVENIHRHRALDPNASLVSLIPRAVDEVGGPTILATFTVIAALLPMAFVTGLMGPYMSPIPINASMGMLISLAVAFVVTPWLAWKLAPRNGAHAHAESRLDGWLASTFSRLLTPFVDPARGGRRRVVLAVGIVAAIALSVSLAGVKLVVLKMLPFDNKSELSLVVDLPAGSPVEATAAALAEMGAYVATVDEVTDFQAYAGTASPINFNGLVRQYELRQMPEQGDLQVNLVDSRHRSRQSHDIALAMRPPLEAIGAKHRAKVKVVEVPPGPPVLSPIVAEVYGPDEPGRHAVAKALRKAFVETPGIVGVDDSIEDNAPRALVRVDQRKASLAGVTTSDIVNAMRAALSGDDVTALHDGQAKYGVPVRITLPPEQQGRLDRLLTMTVRASDGATIPLAELVSVKPALREKTRYRKDLMPVTYVIGDMAGETDSPLYGMFGVRGRLAGVAVPNGTLGEHFIGQPSDPYRGYSLKWDGEWQVTYETFRDMGIAYGVGLVLIYLLVVAQFGSYVTPLVIMAPIPLTIIGVMPGHALLGRPFTATSMIGMIALAGIIVRNSILLVDFVNLQTARGVALAQAIVDAAAARAKPIALTGLAAMLGALFIVNDPIFSGLAISLVFGILVSTLLTLVVIPVLYYAVHRRRGEPATAAAAVIAP
jgi:multidrug efflux pump subunit AcrB